MKRFLMLLVAVLALCLGLPATANASWDWSHSTPASTQGWDWSHQAGDPNKIPCDKTQKMCKTGYKAQGLDTYEPNSNYSEPTNIIQTAGNGNAMGVQPNWWTICIANGYGPTAAGPAGSWNDPVRSLTVSVRNICTGYSITNRMTVDNVNNAGACIQYSNTGTTAPTAMQHWGPYYYIWDENIVIWANTRSGCNDPGEIEHSVCKGVGYALGLVYVSGTPETCMGTDNGWNRATFGDLVDVNEIYKR